MPRPSRKSTKSGPPMARPVTMAAPQKPSAGPVSRGLGTRHSVLTITRAVSANTRTLMPMRSADGSSVLRAYTPMGAPRAPATTIGVSSR